MTRAFSGYADLVRYAFIAFFAFFAFDCLSVLVSIAIYFVICDVRSKRSVLDLFWAADDASMSGWVVTLKKLDLLFPISSTDNEELDRS